MLELPDIIQDVQFFAFYVNHHFSVEVCPKYCMGYTHTASYLLLI